MFCISPHYVSVRVLIGRVGADGRWGCSTFRIYLDVLASRRNRDLAHTPRSTLDREESPSFISGPVAYLLRSRPPRTRIGHQIRPSNTPARPASIYQISETPQRQQGSKSRRRTPWSRRDFAGRAQCAVMRDCDEIPLPHHHRPRPRPEHTGPRGNPACPRAVCDTKIDLSAAGGAGGCVGGGAVCRSAHRRSRGEVLSRGGHIGPPRLLIGSKGQPDTSAPDPRGSLLFARPATEMDARSATRLDRRLGGGLAGHAGHPTARSVLKGTGLQIMRPPHFG